MDRAATGGAGPADSSVLAIIDGLSDPAPVLAEAKRLALALRTDWTALYVETPDDGGRRDKAGEALAAAASLGGSPLSIPAPTLLDGVVAHLSHAAFRHAVVGVSAQRRLSPWSRRTLVEALLEARPGASIVAVATERHPQKGAAGPRGQRVSPAPNAYLLAAVLVAATLPVLLLLKSLIGAQGLGLVFLVPVLAIAAKAGFRPAVLASFLSVAAYDFFILKPDFEFQIGLPQDLLVLTILLLLAGYTSFLTGRLRSRALLSDRSARENATLASLALHLTKASDWKSTAEVLCRDTSALLDVHAVLLREVDGKFVVEGAAPSEPSLGSLDLAALHLAWTTGEETGSGTTRAQSADWQFLPLRTSLGTLAVLGLARTDGLNPVAPAKKTLLATIVAQGALAHERLRLEDQSKCPSAAQAGPETTPAVPLRESD